MDDWAYVPDLPLAIKLAGRGDMFFDMDKMERQMSLELAFYHPARFVGMNEAHEAEYRRFDDEDSTNWIHVDSRWEDEADINYNNSERGRADAMTVLRKTARFGIHGNAAMKMREASEIKELMRAIAREADDLLAGPPGDPIQYLMFVQVGA